MANDKCAPPLAVACLISSGGSSYWHSPGSWPDRLRVRRASQLSHIDYCGAARPLGSIALSPTGDWRAQSRGAPKTGLG